MADRDPEAVDDAPVTVVTGASRGIGRHLADYLCERGHRVIGCARNAPDDGTSTMRWVTADVTDELAVRHVFRVARQTCGRVDNLVHAAGTASMNHTLLTPTASARRIIDVNFLGTFLCCREAAKAMRRACYGRIVTFSSVAVPLGLAGEAVYAASKAAVETFTRVLAREVAEFGITANCVGPGPLRTNLTERVPDSALDAVTERLSAPRMQHLDDIANSVEFFLSPASALVTGQTLYLGGP